MTISARLGESDKPWIRLTEAQHEARLRVLQKYRDGTYAVEDVPCYCGSTRAVPIAQRDRYGLPVQTMLCEDCGLLRTSPRMTQEATNRFYENDYRDLYTGPGNVDNLFQQQLNRGRQLAQLLERITPPGSSVYEIGCGAGGILAAFAERGCTVSGADLGSEYLDRGAQAGLDLIHGTSSDLLAHRGAQADVVLLLHVVEHFLDLRTELTEVMQLIRPGGVLYVEVPGVGEIKSQYRGDILRFLQNAHTYHFTARTLSYVMQSVGFEVTTATEHAIAVCVRPEPGKRVEPAKPPQGEALRVLRHLAELEKELLRNANAA